MRAFFILIIAALGTAALTACEAVQISNPMHTDDAGTEIDAGDITTSNDAGSAEERLHARIFKAASPLTRAPFGPGSAVSAMNGAVAVSLAQGLATPDGAAVDAGTRFNVASVSKVLTAARVVSLAHEGVLGLDDSVSMHLPGVKLRDASATDLSSSITIRDLLTHRAGVPKQPADLVSKVNGRWSDPSLLRKLTDSWDITLQQAPGSFLYSNFGYALLGAIIERAKGCSFADCMATYLSELGMPRSTYWPATLDGDAASGRVETNGVVSFNEPTWYASRYAIPFTGLWTSMPELAQFGAKLIAASKDSSAPLHAMTTGRDYGLGLIQSTRLGASSLEHDGSGPGFYAGLVLIPSKQLVLALATNGGNELQNEVLAFGQITQALVSAIPEPGQQ